MDRFTTNSSNRIKHLFFLSCCLLLSPIFFFGLQGHMQEMCATVIGMAVISCRPDPLQQVCTLEDCKALLSLPEGQSRVGFLLTFCTCHSCLEPKSRIFHTYILDLKFSIASFRCLVLFSYYYLYLKKNKIPGRQKDEKNMLHVCKITSSATIVSVAHLSTKKTHICSNYYKCVIK